MEESIWVDYSGQSTKELITLETKNCRIDSLVCAFERGLNIKYQLNKYDPNVDTDHYLKLSSEEYTILAIRALDREVNNGGYHQFFTNSSARYVPVIVSLLYEIGCPITAKITQDAINCLNISQSPTEAEVEIAIYTEIESEEERISKALDNCNDRFYKETEDIFYKLFEYIKLNSEKIILP
jgi:hypothetical protein